MSPTRDAVEQWIEGYVRAWRTNDPDDIAALFGEGARYFTAPHREPWSGRPAIVEGWLGRREEPGTWSFRHEVLAIDGELAVVRGWTHYETDSDYSNLWLIRFDPDSRASELVEWWMPEEG